MLEPNRNYVIDTNGNIHKMRFVGDCDWEDEAVTSLQEIRADAIREFAVRVKSSQDAYSWCCHDNAMEFCNGDHCESCMEDFKKKIDEIAEQIITDMKK